MASDKLDIHFTAGTRSELDRQFREVVFSEKPDNLSMSDFIKQIVVEWYYNRRPNHEELSAIEKVKVELLSRIQELEFKINSGEIRLLNEIKTSETQEEKKEIEVKLKSLVDVF